MSAIVPENSDEDNVSQRKQSAVTTINDILRFITPDEEYIFENYEVLSNVSSDLSDPFSDFDGDQFYQEQKAKRLSKLESDIYLMESFSKEFLRIQDVVRTEMKLGTNMCSEDLLNIKPRDIPKGDEYKEIQQIVKEVLGDDDQYVMNLNKTRETPIKRRESRNFLPPVKSPFSEQNFETNSMSGVWRMLEAKSNDGGFPITPMGYNIYKDKNFDFLTRADMPWEAKEKCRKKCEDWLKKLDKK